MVYDHLFAISFQRKLEKVKKAANHFHHYNARHDFFIPLHQKQNYMVDYFKTRKYLFWSCLNQSGKSATKIDLNTYNNALIIMENIMKNHKINLDYKYWFFYCCTKNIQSNSSTRNFTM